MGMGEINGGMKYVLCEFLVLLRCIRRSVYWHYLFLVCLVAHHLVHVKTDTSVMIPDMHGTSSVHSGTLSGSCGD